MANNSPNPFERNDAQERTRTCITVAAISVLCLVLLAALGVIPLLLYLRDPLQNIRSLPLISQLLGTRTAPPNAVPGKMAGWETVYSETYNEPRSADRWAEDYAVLDDVVQAGVYRLYAMAKEDFLMGDTFDTEPLSDIYISMDIEQVSGTDQAEYGVTLRETDDGNYYYFAVTENWQEYSFGKWFNDQWVDIIDWTRTTAIHKDSPNRLAVLAEGSQFTLFINDQSVAQVTDTSIDQGIPGYIVGIWQANVDATFELDNIEVRAP